MKKKKVVDLRYAKSPDYRRVVERIAAKGSCPFCPRDFKYHRKRILKRSGQWFITENSWPYRNAKHHFVIIGDTHKERIAEITDSDLSDILKLIQWAEKKFRIPGGAFAMRFGDTSHTGATVCHLHCHLIVPRLNRKTKQVRTVHFPIG